MKQKRWCGMTAKIGSVLAGFFSLMATKMYLIFEVKYLGKGNATDTPPNGTNSLINQFIALWSLEIVLFQSCVTIVISCFLIYSVYAQIYMGVMLYITWIPLFEVTNIVVQVHTTANCRLNEVRAMRWFGLISRIFFHCFWMFFTIQEAHIIYKLRSKGNIISYRRRISATNEEYSRRLSKINNYHRRCNDQFQSSSHP
ncbi:transmembrane protein 217 [Erinaceus europaeus]|uniref:Transmembrane protein 217 n=1 Tax=Erinaceus europaeus TaxID=9365 RepID=A0A1S2ZDX0_ERIEU|nr:transmembrane protein 217 [Erinaceus europaeus]XP_060045716.1 transmembrane protein 217 [Erinaceus europaeus]